MTGTARVARGRRLILAGHGSAESGLGHLMRLLALGQAWSDAGGRVEAVLGSAPESMVERYRAEGFIVRDVGMSSRATCATLAHDLAADPEAVSAIDRPDLTADDLDVLGAASGHVLVIDDMAELERYPVALVLNQNVHADRSAYPAHEGVQFLLGLSFVLLRREFQGAATRREIPPRVRHLLVTFGGSDPLGMTRRTLDALVLEPASATHGLDVKAVIGAANPIDLDESAYRGLHLTVERAVEDMGSRMTWADLAVTSGGSTVWELARTGCPALVIETAPAEPLLVSGLARIGLFERLGPASGLDAASLRAAIERRIDDQGWRAEMSRLGPQLVDGGGAGRVVAALAALDGR